MSSAFSFPSPSLHPTVGWGLMVAVISVCRMEDIIERYRNEVILDGLKLGNPLPIVCIKQCQFYFFLRVPSYHFCIVKWVFCDCHVMQDPEVLKQSLSPQQGSRMVENLPAQRHNRRPSDLSSRPEMPGDLTGTLSLKKGD